MPRAKARWIGMLVGIALLASGCATVQVAAPESAPYAFRSYPGAAVVAVAQLQDQRGNPSDLGIIGMSPVRTKEDMTRTVTEAILQAFNEAGYNVERVGTGTAGAPEGTTCLIQGTLEQVHMHSVDAILQPVELNVGWTLTVAGRDGRPLYQQRYATLLSERMGFAFGLGGGLWQAKFARTGIQQVAAQVAADPRLQAIIQQAHLARTTVQPEVSTTPLAESGSSADVPSP